MVSSRSIAFLYEKYLGYLGTQKFLRPGHCTIASLPPTSMKGLTMFYFATRWRRAPNEKFMGEWTILIKGGGEGSLEGREDFSKFSGEFTSGES